MNSPSQEAFTQQQALASWAGVAQPDPELQRFLRQQQTQAEEQAEAQQTRLRYLETAGFPSSALQEALNSLTQALQNAANAAWQAGDMPAYWRRQQEMTSETQRAASREQQGERRGVEERATEARARLEYAKAARLPKEFRDVLRGELTQALQEAGQTALRQGETTLFWQRKAEIARLQERPDRSEALLRRIIGGPAGAEEALAPVQMLRALGPESRVQSLGSRVPSLTIRLELTEGLKAKVVEEANLSSLQLITRIVEGMG